MKVIPAHPSWKFQIFQFLISSESLSEPEHTYIYVYK